MNRHKRVDTVDDNWLKTDWQENINIGAQEAENRHKDLEKLAEFQQMWNGRLGRIDMALQRIKPNKLDVRAITFGPCRAGPKAGELENTTNDKRFCMNVTESA